MNLTSKYEIGDLVYGTWVNTEIHRTTCPDCLDRATWSVTTPAGETFEIPCGTCTYGFNLAKKVVKVGTARPLHVGQVRIESGRENEVSYMCEETGIGSGTVWRESRLFSTEEEALRVAALDAATEQRAYDTRTAEEIAARKKQGRRKPENGGSR